VVKDIYLPAVIGQQHITMRPTLYSCVTACMIETGGLEWQ